MFIFALLLLRDKGFKENDEAHPVKNDEGLESKMRYRLQGLIKLLVGILELSNGLILPKNGIEAAKNQSEENYNVIFHKIISSKKE